MSEELAARNGNGTGPSLTTEQLDLLKRTICRGSSDDEFQLFISTAKRLGLDPFARQIFAVKRWDGREKREVMSIQTSIDGFRLIAERTGCYAPGRPTTFEVDSGGAVVSATAYVKKWAHDSWHEIGETAYYDEYVQLTKDGGPNSMWKRMPRTMLAKCAESRALRRAFPAELSGVYTAEEMGQADSPSRDEFKAPVVSIDSAREEATDSDLPDPIEVHITEAGVLEDLPPIRKQIEALPDSNRRRRLIDLYKMAQKRLLADINYSRTKREEEQQ